MTIHSASASTSGSARAFSAISAPTPAGSPIVMAILGGCTGPPTVAWMAKIECICKCVAVAKSAGFRNDDAAFCITTPDHPPRNSGSYFACKQDAGRVKRTEYESRGFASGEDEGGGGCRVEGGADDFRRWIIP